MMSEFTRHKIVDLEAGSEGVDATNNLTFHTHSLACDAKRIVRWLCLTGFEVEQDIGAEWNPN